MSPNQGIISINLIISLLFFLITFIVYNFGFKTWLQFYRSGLKYDLGIPIFGSHYRQLLNIETWYETLRKLYYKHPKERFVLLQDIGGGPAYLIRDPELVKQVTIKDFDCFTDRYEDVNTLTDPLIGHGLTNSKGTHWRNLRNLLTPLFTSQKLKQVLIPSLIEVKQELIQHIIGHMTNNVYEVDMLKLSTCSSIDAFSLSALGIKTTAVKENGDKLYNVGTSLIENMEGLSLLQRVAILHFPKSMRYLLGKGLVKKDDSDFFGRLFKDVATYRRKEKVERTDYVDLFNRTEEYKKSAQDNAEHLFKGLGAFSEAEVISQIYEFFEAAITENNVLLNFISQQLANNREIQNRLHNECQDIQQKLDAEPLNYESLQQMKYMDMVISEGLRLYPIAPELKRRATKKYVLDNYDGVKAIVNPGDAVWIPAHILQNDPRYYPNPSVFDPERFSPSQKLNNVAGTYAPFGMGPRDCIGCRYTTFEMRITIYYLLLQFQFEKVEEDINKSVKSSNIRLRLRQS